MPVTWKNGRPPLFWAKGTPPRPRLEARVLLLAFSCRPA